MAVTKTPRKKPSATVETEPEPAKKKRAPATKKAVVEPKETPVLAAPPVKTSVKEKAPAKTKKGTVAAVEAALPEVMVEQPARPESTTELPPLVQVLYRAIQEGRPMEFIFADGDANAPRTFEPRHLTFDTLSQAWFVWGWDRRYNAERYHRVDLLAEVNPVEGVGRAAQGPYPEGTPANLIGGWFGGEPISVKLTLQKQWVFAVKQAPPAFPRFKIEEQGEGQALVSFTATDLRAIARWVMQFGDGVQVLEPARLVDRVKQVGASWAGRERTAPMPAPAPRPAPPAEPAADHRRTESRPHHEPRPHREARHEREEQPSAKPSKVEVIKFDRL
ncbi:MAG TPA: WYL domain-containing protein [Geothrix sp.]|nr:WYL domain-containing protein [Geothrix sp.]